MKRAWITLVVLFFANIFAQKPTPGAPQSGSIKITNVVVHIGNGSLIEKGEVGFHKGKIVYVGDLSKPSTDNREYDKVIDGKGQHLYPGFILLDNTIGLREIDLVRATLDYREVGELKPEVRTITSFNTDSKIIPTVRTNGVLIAQPTPRGGLISGQSSVVHLDAWNWEDAAIKMEDGVHVNWPSRNQTVRRWSKNLTASRIRKRRTSNVDKIKDIYNRTITYMAQDEKAYNGKCEALAGVFDGSKTLYLHVNSEKDIIESVTYFEEVGVKRIVLVGAYEGHKIAKFLVDHKLPVILNRTHSLPGQVDDDITLPFKMAKILWDAGVLVSVSYQGDMEAMGSRNLPFTVGTTIAYGMQPEDAVQLVTLNAAKILGIDDQFGTIEVNKSATFFLSKGDALDMRSNSLVFAFIQGRELDLYNSQQYLYDMYSKKYGLD